MWQSFIQGLPSMIGPIIVFTALVSLSLSIVYHLHVRGYKACMVLCTVCVGSRRVLAMAVVMMD